MYMRDEHFRYLSNRIRRVRLGSAVFDNKGHLLDHVLLCFHSTVGVAPVRVHMAQAISQYCGEQHPLEWHRLGVPGERRSLLSQDSINVYVEFRPHAPSGWPATTGAFVFTADDSRESYRVEVLP